MFAFQSLHSGHFIIADHFFILFGQIWGLLIDRIDVIHFFIKLVVIARGQPVADLVWLNIRFFLKDVPRGGAKLCRQCLG
jgi:hypothetical protein